MPIGFHSDRMDLAHDRKYSCSLDILSGTVDYAPFLS